MPVQIANAPTGQKPAAKADCHGTLFHRPSIFAWVVSLGILLSGFIALRALPIEQYPEVAPPSLAINVVYPGADAETLEQNVTQVIEQQLNGVEGFLYMSSSSLSNGTASITLTFEAGTDIDIAQTEVQNRLSTVEARLPEEVRRQGITVRQANAGFLLIVALTSETGALDSTDLGNIASTQVIDELRRVTGVGDVTLFGSEYAMRIWLDPDKLASYNLSPSAVVAAIREQNAQTAGGSLGALPLQEGQQITAPSPLRTALKPKTSSAASSCAPTRAVPASGWATSRGWRSVRRPMQPRPRSTGSLWRAWRSSSPPAPMRWPPPKV